VSGESARLFVALELPPPARSSLAQWSGAQLQGVSGLRAIEPEALHVTLCFLGWCPVAEIERIGSECQTLGGQRSIDLSFGEVRWLPPRRPKVIAIELHDRSGRLTELQSRLSDRLSAAGLHEPERRPFLGHVTVARVARNAGLRPVELPAPPPLRFRSSTVTLFRSWLGPRGARYEPLARVELRGA
jgi:RNA 2',3'-cyclic 3'-phosphodiesterase